MGLSKKSLIVWMLLLWLPAALFAGKGPEVRVCLVLAVGNDKEVISKSLSSVRTLVDCIAITNWGSTDRTLELVDDFTLETKIPIAIEQENAPELGYDRLTSLNFARAFVKTLGYNLDSTYFLVWEPDLELQGAALCNKRTFTKDAYLVLQRSSHLKMFNYGARLLRASLDWQQQGVIYPYYTCAQPVDQEALTMLAIDDLGENRYATDKLKGAARYLAEEVRRDPHSTRNLFYFAETLKALGEYREAIRWYQARIALGGDREELWFCQYMRGQCFEELGKWDRALSAYLEAFQYAPDRPETLHRIAHFYRVLGKNDLAYLFAKHGAKLPYPRNPQIGTVPEMGAYQFIEELSVASYYTRFRQEGYEANNLLVLRRDVPWYVKDQAYRNLQFYVQPLPAAQYVPIELELPPVEEGKEERYRPMNPSIAQTEEGYAVILRSVNYTQVGAKMFTTNDPDGIFRTRNFLVSMDRNFTPLSQVEILDDPYRFRYGSCGVEGLEDCRVFPYQQGWWFTCTTADTSEYGSRQISLCLLGEGEGAVEVAHLTPLLGPDPVRCEKNWLPFVAGGELYVLYSCDPLLILKPDLVTGECEEAISHTATADFTHFRGSAAPIPFDGGYLMLVHETVINPDYHRFYLHRFVKLDAHFHIVALSLPFIFRHVGIEFCCGMTWDHAEREIVLGVGVEDREAYLCRVPASAIRSMLQPLPEDL